ncbi:MAG TPA: hypothetical protein VLI05_01495 [Candidatus Saccharimonadia bacterium]|nr:hypothetical protein [Candidatus Saccharimonadia bacterium]
MKRILRALSFSVFVFGFAGWLYIAENAVHHPQTLPLPLTHLAPFPREDTFGALCFGLSFVALFIYMYLKESRPNH